MENDLFSDQYQGQSVKELISLEASHRIDSLVLAFEAALDHKKENGKKLSDIEVNILSIGALDREVNNGGFRQFFYNSSAEYTPNIVKALTSIGCLEIAHLTKKAIDFLELEHLDSDLIEDRMDAEDEVLENNLGQLDDEFYGSTDIMAHKLFDYIKINSHTIQLS